MKCILMNKNTEVLSAEYNPVFGIFDMFYETYNIDYAPYIIKKYYETIDDETEFLNKLTEWFKGRGIPRFRDKLDLLLHRLGIDTEIELLDKAFGLSLSDQYWIKPVDVNLKYDEINFFDNDFDYAEFLEASLSVNSSFKVRKSSLKTPNNTTDGMLKKAWIIENKTRYLLKSGYKNEILQPYNEVLASIICGKLGFSHVTYELDKYKDVVVSKCPCFINNDTEFIPASQIINKNSNYEDYIKILEKHNIKDARIKVENMYILDFLIMNEDRHLNNFGIIRDVNTLKWLDVAPIFDNGMALNVDYYTDGEVATTGLARFFYSQIPFDDLLKIIKNIKRLDVSNLNDIVDNFNELLHTYNNISNKRIDVLCTLFNRQVNKLKDLVNS